MLISLRDDHRTKPSRERARHPQRRSERAACSMQARYAIWNIIDALTRDPSNLAISLRLS
jgi:hypothetical protein